MKPPARVHHVLVALLAGLAASAAQARLHDSHEKRPKVLIIGLDGLRSDALLAADAPNLHALIADGCFTDQSHTGAPTVSGPGWSSVLCGVWHIKHGVKDNTFRGANYTQYPHMFARLKEVRPELKLASWVTWEEIEKYIVPSSTDIHVFYSYKDHGDEKNSLRAASDLSSADIDLGFYYVSDIDETGHNSGFHPAIPEYMAAIKTADEQVGKVLAAIRSRPTYGDENWLYILTPDHGGTIDGSHGRDVDAHRRIFYAVSGASAARGTIRDTVNQVDVMPTVLAHLGIAPRPEWNLDGRVRGLPRTRSFGQNLVDNGDAEAAAPGTAQDQNLGIPGWVDLGGMTTIAYGAMGGFPSTTCPGPAQRGRAFFAGGSTDCEITQTIDLADFASDIDRGVVTFDFSAWLGGYAEQRDVASIDIRFLDERGGALGAAALKPVNLQERLAATGAKGEAATCLIERHSKGNMPTKARVAVIRLQSLAGQGSADG